MCIKRQEAKGWKTSDLGWQQAITLGEQGTHEMGELGVTKGRQERRKAKTTS